MITFDREIHARRIKRVRDNMATSGCDGALLTNLSSIRYLTGFTGSTALFALTPAREHLIVDFRYVEQAQAQCPCAITRRDGPLERSLRTWLDGVTICGIEARHVTLDLMDLFRRAGAPHAHDPREPDPHERDPRKPDPRELDPRELDPHELDPHEPDPHKRDPHERVSRENSMPPIFDIEWHPLPDLVESLRVVKDETEIAKLAASAELLEKLMQRAIDHVKAGVRELDVALEFENAARRETGRLLPFEPIIASGARAALPHGIASTKPIEIGDLVVIDIGLDLDGYVADMTRTVAAGRADDRMREVHHAVHLANRTAAKGICCGMSGGEAHMLAAAVLAEYKLDTYFGHGLGHGIGIEIHEDPRLSPNVLETLQPGMVFTIEPGVYIPGWGGVRIEDAGVLRSDGMEIFNKMERGLIVV